MGTGGAKKGGSRGGGREERTTCKRWGRTRQGHHGEAISSPTNPAPHECAPHLQAHKPAASPRPPKPASSPPLSSRSTLNLLSQSQVPPQMLPQSHMRRQSRAARAPLFRRRDDLRLISPGSH